MNIIKNAKHNVQMQIHKTHHQINLSAVESASQNMFLVPMKNCGQSFKLWKVSKTDRYFRAVAVCRPI